MKLFDVLESELTETSYQQKQAVEYMYHKLLDQYRRARLHTNEAAICRQKMIKLKSIWAMYPTTAFWYSRQILGSNRFIEGEPIIATNAKLAEVYAIQVMAQRWPEAESSIARNKKTKHSYEKYFKCKL